MNLAELANNVGLWPLLGTLLPLVVALCTREQTKSGIKGVLFAGAAVIFGVAEAGVQAIQDGQHYNWATALGAALGAWVLGQVAHSNLWKSLGLSALLQQVGAKRPAVPLQPSEFDEVQS